MCQAGCAHCKGPHGAEPPRTKSSCRALRLQQHPRAGCRGSRRSESPAGQTQRACTTPVVLLGRQLETRIQNCILSYIYAIDLISEAGNAFRQENDLLILVFEATDVSLVLLYGVQHDVTRAAGVPLPS